MAHTEIDEQIELATELAGAWEDDYVDPVLLIDLLDYLATCGLVLRRAESDVTSLAYQAAVSRSAGSATT